MPDNVFEDQDFLPQVFQKSVCKKEEVLQLIQNQQNFPCAEARLSLRIFHPSPWHRLVGSHWGFQPGVHISNHGILTASNRAGSQASHFPWAKSVSGSLNRVWCLESIQRISQEVSKWNHTVTSCLKCPWAFQMVHTCLTESYNCTFIPSPSTSSSICPEHWNLQYSRLFHLFGGSIMVKTYIIS